MSRGENPAFYRNPTPSVDDDREAAIIGADAQPEERVPIRLQERELDPVLFQQSTDVADWLLEADSNRFPAACTTFAGSARRLTGAPFSNRNRQWSFRSGSSPA